MNNKKKIIDTLRSADKASVEKLMAEEAKKNEIFAKAQRRANIEHNEYTDVVSGVEKYERRISMTKIASIAAAAVLVVGSIGGGAYLLKNNGKPDMPEPVLNEATTNPTVTANTTTAKAASTKVTSITTTAKVSETTTAKTTVTTAAGKAQVTVVGEVTAKVNNEQKNNNTEQKTNNNQQKNNNKEEEILAKIRENSEFGEETESIYRKYAEIISEYGEMIRVKDNNSQKYGDDIASEFLIGSYDESVKAGYAFYDVNEDGVQELLLGENYGIPDYGFDSVIYNIYTVNNNGEVYLLAKGGARDRFYICTNSTVDRTGMQHGAFISEEGSGGATFSSNKFYRLGSDGLRYIESVFTDGIDENNEALAYYTKEEPYTDKSTQITMDEFWKISDSYHHVYIEFTPFN